MRHPAPRPPSCPQAAGQQTAPAAPAPAAAAAHALPAAACDQGHHGRAAGGTAADARLAKVQHHMQH